MIKNTYYNLPTEKKNRIVQAIKKEVDGKSYDKISINQIVARAEISRGSFYQYFDDKKDILLLLLDGFTENVYHTFQKTLLESNGDIFFACQNVFDYVLTSYEHENYSVALNSVFLYSNINSVLFLKDDRCKDNLMKSIMQNINRQKFLIENDETVNCIMDLLFSAMGKLWFDVFILQKNKENVKFKLSCMFSVIQNGLLRR